ncbi:hypothetical protein E3Q23_03175 [Wallemia mellicola]|uniref:SCO1 protein n=1 Tax=Wallemia mellicola TaxID=1708541 RepID=A0A4T0PW19_9BASI|nr:hypothetical protein E3Q24_03205 [Wallemia mellicola]TIB72949.1 hypothetical protein E3Q23_03175 [Wallemia mellicola]TIB82608.1 SCO1 protein [Wallemia mellicola]TIB85326.1 SCO1 protein [Wallemia mellicola]TIC02642.1 SCO1 protein [Wallemia mellicola]
MLRYRNLLRQSSHYNKSIISPFYLSNSSRSIQTKSQQRDKAFVGPFNWVSASLFVATGVGLYYYFNKAKAEVEESKKRKISESEKLGKPKIGGPFSLIDAKTENSFTHENLLGRFSLVYFGFTNCPDICPDELDKMGTVVDRVDAKLGQIVQPVFISCDPARDTTAQTRKYLEGEFLIRFHPRMVGLTGPWENVRAACKVYRVYFSTPPNISPNEDYLVDHSIFMYLMDPNGEFVEAFGKNTTAEQMADKVLSYTESYVQNK